MSKEDESEGLNRVVLVGEVTSSLVTRELSDESVVSTFDLLTDVEAGRVTVPVSVDGVLSVRCICGQQNRGCGRCHYAYAPQGSGTKGRAISGGRSLVLS